MTNPIHMLLEAQATARPNDVMLRDHDGTQHTFGAMQDAACAMADLLTLQGVRAGDRVLIVTENCAAAIATLFGAARIGAWATPVNARLSDAELDRIITHATPRAVLFMSCVSDDAAGHGMRLGATQITTRLGAAALSTPFTSNPAQDRDVGVMLYTTGTTGTPKGVMLTHDNLTFAGQASAQLRGMRPGDVIYGALPISHVFGLASMVMAATYAGAAIRLQPRFTPAALYNALRDDVTVLPAVPQMHALLMQYTRAQGHARLEGSRLRYVSSGAAPLDAEWKRSAEQFYGIALQNGYGMTESTAGICATEAPIGSADVSVGGPLPGVEITLDAPGIDGVGEILTRGPHVMRGYYYAPEETARVLRTDGFLRTGDLGTLDGDGRLTIVGRAKELIIRSGFNVYPQEVEAALNQHPSVALSAVIGRADEGNEEVIAFVQTTDTALTEATILSFITPLLTAYKRPSRVIITDQLPAAATGKILKHKLLDTFADELSHA